MTSQDRGIGSPPRKIAKLHPHLPHRRRARRSSAFHPTALAAAPSPYPTARPSRYRAPLWASGSPATSDGWLDDHVRRIGQEAVFPLVTASLAASRERYTKSIGEARLMVGNVIQLMCRSPKSRAGCHFGAAIGLRLLLRALRRRSRLGERSAYTRREKAGPWPLTFARKAGSWYRSRPVTIPARTKPTGRGGSKQGK